jgi:hypothetical protein
MFGYDTRWVPMVEKFKVKSVLSFTVNNNLALGLYSRLGWTSTQMVPSSIWLRPLNGHIKPQKLDLNSESPI